MNDTTPKVPKRLSGGWWADFFDACDEAARELEAATVSDEEEQGFSGNPEKEPQSSLPQGG